MIPNGDLAGFAQVIGPLVQGTGNLRIPTIGEGGNRAQQPDHVVRRDALGADECVDPQFDLAVLGIVLWSDQRREPGRSQHAVEHRLLVSRLARVERPVTLHHEAVVLAVEPHAHVDVAFALRVAIGLGGDFN